jgi:polyisoprenoid-binding protein YceI
MSTVSVPTGIPAGTWTVDPIHSNVGFAVKHMGIATVRGAFTEFKGTIEIGDDLSAAKAYGTVNVESIETNEPQRDSHLRSPDFLDAPHYPQLRFESTRMIALDDQAFRITGNLTIRGISKEITWGNTRIGLEVTGQLSRADYGMRFNQALGSGNLLVGDKVNLALDISAVKAA